MTIQNAGRLFSLAGSAFISNMRMPLFTTLRPLLIFVCFLSAEQAGASAQGVSGPGTMVFVETDTVADDNWSDETYYSIEILRLQRWVREHAKSFSNGAALEESARLINEAEQFAASGDYEMAAAWIETVWDLLQPESGPITPNAEVATMQNLDASALPAAKPRLTWSKQMTSGLDFWHQEFSFRFLESDSTFLERNGNPYSGVRVSFGYAAGEKTTLRGLSSFKYSRDYLTADAEFTFSGHSGQNHNWKIENRTEGTSFYRDFNLRYLQNRSTAKFGHRFGRLTLEAENNFLIRSYAGSDTSYQDYWNNSFLSAARFSLAPGALLTLGYRNVVRKHPDRPVNDYLDNRMEFAWLQSFGSLASLHLNYELRFRDYRNVPQDHFFQDFWEHYLLGEVNLGLSRKTGLEVTGGFTSREYRFVSANSLPDFINWDIQPALYLKMSDNWRLAGGLRYEREMHQELVSRVNSVDAESVFSIQFEDFYAIGPVVTIDFINVDGLLLSLRESYLFRRYPNTRTSSVDAFNLYSDRNINSILLLLTWSVTPRWQLTVLANLDDDRSRKDTTGDSRNTLVGVEIGYSF